MRFLDDNQRRILRAICDTFVPRIDAPDDGGAPLYEFSASDRLIVDQVEAAIYRRADHNGREQFRRLLRTMESGLANGLFAGCWGDFSMMPLAERTKVLRSWSASRLPWRRRAFQMIKRQTLFLAYTSGVDGQPSPAWATIGYAPPASPPAITNDRRSELTTINSDATESLNAEILVVGSGAGGGVAAAELAAAGFDVLIVEKGDYFRDVDFVADERQGSRRMYEGGGALATDDGAVSVLAGSTLGGGTTINWMTSLSPPDFVLRQWASEYGFQAATSGSFQRSIDAVSQRMRVTRDESTLNHNNALLEAGCHALGFKSEVLPRNAHGCGECDFCMFGCAGGGKQDGRVTYLLDAHRHGTRILVRSHVDHIEHAGGQVTGARVVVRGADGARKRISVRAKAVVMAAGAIHSPAVLLRSGLTHSHLGQHLHLHPTTAVFARYDQPISPWRGVPQSRVCNEFSNMDGKGYGVRLETAPGHPGLSALAIPWQSGEQHKRLMQHLRQMGNIVVLSRDRFGGHVDLHSNGRPRLHYKIHPEDSKRLLGGTIAALRVQHAAGAREVFAPDNRCMVHGDHAGQNFSTFLRQVRRRGIQPNSFPLFSAHQMSTCRLHGQRNLGPVDPNGQTRELRNLFVVDASVLPNAPGVNPMLTIMAVSHYLSQHIKAKLGR